MRRGIVLAGDETIGKRDVRIVDVDKPRPSIVLDIDDAEMLYRVAPGRGSRGDGPAVTVKLESKERGILGLTKATFFRLDMIQWVEREAVRHKTGKHCPPGLYTEIMEMILRSGTETSQ